MVTTTTNTVKSIHIWWRYGGKKYVSAFISVIRIKYKLLSSTSHLQFITQNKTYFVMMRKCHKLCGLRKLYECLNDWSFILCKYLLLDSDLHLLNSLHTLMHNFSNTDFNTLLSSIPGLCQVVFQFENFKPNLLTHFLFPYITAWP